MRQELFSELLNFQGVYVSKRQVMQHLWQNLMLCLLLSSASRENKIALSACQEFKRVNWGERGTASARLGSSWFSFEDYIYTTPVLLEKHNTTQALVQKNVSQTVCNDLFGNSQKFRKYYKVLKRCTSVPPEMEIKSGV